MEKRRRFIYGELRMKGSGAQASKAEKLASFLYMYCVFYDFALFILHEYLVNP